MEFLANKHFTDVVFVGNAERNIFQSREAVNETATRESCDDEGCEARVSSTIYIDYDVLENSALVYPNVPPERKFNSNKDKLDLLLSRQFLKKDFKGSSDYFYEENFTTIFPD